MEVVRLNREMDDVEVAAGGGGETAVHCWTDAAGTQRWETADAPQRDVERMAVVVHRPSAMRNAGRRPDRLSSGSRTTTAVSAKGQRLL
jgi:hypothetical protein